MIMPLASWTSSPSSPRKLEDMEDMEDAQHAQHWCPLVASTAASTAPKGQGADLRSTTAMAIGQHKIDGKHLGVRAVYRVPNSESSSSAPDQNLCCEMGLLQMSSALTLFDSCSLARNIWRFPKIGVPPVLIQFSRLFRSKPSGSSNYWDTPMTQETPYASMVLLESNVPKNGADPSSKRTASLACGPEQAEHRASCHAQGKHKQTRIRKKDRKTERKKSSEREREREPERTRENQREGKKDFMEKQTVHAIGPSGPGLANNGPTMFTSGGLLLIHSWTMK